MGRAPCCDKTKVKKGPWSPEEDATLKTYVETHGSSGNWIALPQKAGLKRCGKSCRLRWLNYLRPNIKHGGFTEEEDNIIYSLYTKMGSRWSLIAGQLPGRTDNDVKNYWNTKLKKKLVSGNLNTTTNQSDDFGLINNSNQFLPLINQPYSHLEYPSNYPSLDSQNNFQNHSDLDQTNQSFNSDMFLSELGMSTTTVENDQVGSFSDSNSYSVTNDSNQCVVGASGISSDFGFGFGFGFEFGYGYGYPYEYVNIEEI